MDELKRIGAVSALVFGALLIGFAASGSPVGGFASAGFDTGGSRNYTVTGLLQQKPLERNVEVEANVSRVLADYVSEAGNTFQQFYVTDGNRELKIFCSTSSGRTQLEEGDRVEVSGEFQEFYGEYEIYTRCGSVRKD